MLWFKVVMYVFLLLEVGPRVGELYTETIMTKEYLCVCLIICVSIIFQASNDSIFTKFVIKGGLFFVSFVEFSLLSCVCIVGFSKLVNMELMSSKGTMTNGVLICF